MRDLLSTRRGRLGAFFLLYLTEGIPVGFTAVAIATQMRRQGVSPTAVGAFVATLYLPWSWKWAIGPVVDLAYSDRLGRRRGWILAAQVMMAVTLLAAMPVDFVTRLGLFTWIILAHNAFAATQDVAIDALAVATLPAAERGTANGLMFAGAYVGNAVGGSGGLFLGSWIGFGNTFPFVAAAILLVTLTVTLRLREPRLVPRPSSEPSADGADQSSAPAAAATPPVIVPPLNVLTYLRTAAGAIFGSRTAVVGLAFALLPAGAYALSLALQSNLAVEFGLSDRTIAWMGLASTVLAAGGCVAGGWLSDRIGRRKAMTLFIVLTAVPTAWLALSMHQRGWIMPVDPTAADRRHPSVALLAVFWAAALAYSLCQGLMYGARAAFFMDLCDPRVGATQFTAYMAVLNLVIAYSALWQGWCVDRLGYPTTLLIDAAFGCVGLLLLPWCGRRDGPPAFSEAAGSPGGGSPRVGGGTPPSAPG